MTRLRHWNFSLSDLLATPVRYSEAPERIRLELSTGFDLERLISQAGRVSVGQRFGSSDSGN